MTNSSDWTSRRHQRGVKRDGDHRSAFQRDKARVMHSAAFRRLQAKTQVLGIGISDFYRTRLTHSLEAAQIGTGIAAQISIKQNELAKHLAIDEHLIESLCLAHDIGHPPFGHGGEVALHYMMSEFGGFEGNGQTFRILTKLETYSENDGMNLARRTLLGLIKYPNYIDTLKNPDLEISKPHSHRLVKSKHWHPPKGLFSCDKDAFDWVMQPLSSKDKVQFSAYDAVVNSHNRTRYKSIDCSIMELADDIAYAIHDLEDAIVMHMVTRSSFEAEVVSHIKTLGINGLSNKVDEYTDRLFSGLPYQRKNAIGALVNVFITSISIEKLGLFDNDILDYNVTFPASYAKALGLFKLFVYNFVIRKPELQLLEYKGQQIVMELFEAFYSEPERLLPSNTSARWKLAGQDPTSDKFAQHRVIADYISGMTDEYATRLYNHLFLPKSNAVTDSLTP
ncbi:deoxyguanosinetriphosphate triphosphohydrolase family protein [Glaciecola sp. MH2013]|uniref:anti-phage deoxyguanosine triphosphatase n=1 Tax=Glaciecola sp. MH2013 TaxID=2785524 RepID=UPI00189C6242|nr:anti-phage deoxyguanosine triphosphatase [Glaciecola sp. MH2013]MBF7072901.1 deoxyguanosinetriphosphate triphosphohydrolase family protein [Glaciecola sp. MH2013]